MFQDREDAAGQFATRLAIPRPWYSPLRTPLNPAGRTVIVVDDG